MKRLAVVLLVLFTCLVSAGRLYAQLPTPTRNINRFIPHGPRKPTLPQVQPLLRRAGRPALPALATKDVVSATCPPDAATLGAVCGYIDVPLDREHPAQGTIPIYFELYTHSGPSLESAILVNHGGPGLTTTGFRGFWLYLFGPNLDVHDLLLIDDRGRGLSGTIDCEEMQHGAAATFDQGTADCAAQLGSADSRYGTGDIAQDMDAVRSALGYDKVDYYAASYGGADVTAYATRFGNHLRSLVLDAPLGTPGLGTPFAWDRYRTHAEPGMVSRDCQRSLTCSPDHPFPQAELDRLILRVRHSPVKGDAYNANGNLMHIRIDENALLSYLIDSPTGNFASTGELLAAADSLWQEDSRPLLRLGAEGYVPLVGDLGDPTFFSVGAYFATLCGDQTEAFDWSTPLPERTEQFAEAVKDLPHWFFAPFSKEVGAGLLFSIGNRSCLYWEKPTPSSPVAPPHPTYALAPTLVLTGDLDSRVPYGEVSKVAALFPKSTLVSVAEAGHVTVLWTHCAANLASQFIETLQIGDISCTLTPETVWPAVGRFPLLAKFARPAAVDPDGLNQIDLDERKVVTVAVATATDALQRSTIGNGVGVGLRAGTFSTDYGNGSVWTTTLTNCAFSEDVTVNGTVTWDVDGSLVADLTVSGSGTAGGTLHVEGTWYALGPVGDFKVSGTLGGKQVAVLVPEA
jgi:pimeloyl-ACP methyl ester carboxylesterase